MNITCQSTYTVCNVSALQPYTLFQKPTKPVAMKHYRTPLQTENLQHTRYKHSRPITTWPPKQYPLDPVRNGLFSTSQLEAARTPQLRRRRAGACGALSRGMQCRYLV